MVLYGEGFDTIEKQTFRAMGPVSTRKTISLKYWIVEPLKPISTRSRLPKMEIEIPIYLKTKIWSKSIELLGSTNT